MSVFYRISWRTSDARVGAHPSRQTGSGSAFSHHAGLLEAPDPRRLDVHASLRDPFDRLRFRVYRQTGPVPVILIADLSASMGFHGRGDKLRVVADLCTALAEAAWQTGDPFGFIGCDDGLRGDWLQLPRLQRGTGAALAERLRDFVPTAASAEGLLQAPNVLGRRRSLVFLVSDFHLPDRLLERLLAALSRHDVVPTICWDEAEYRDLPRFGWARLRDPETGREHGLLLRPRLRQRIQARFAERRSQLEALLRRHGRRPLYLSSRFEPGDVTRYFHG